MITASMATGWLYQRALYWQCKFTTGKMVPMKDYKSVVGNWYWHHCHYIIFGPCSGMLVNCGYLPSDIITIMSVINVIVFCCSHLSPHPPLHLCWPKCIPQKCQKPPKSINVYLPGSHVKLLDNSVAIINVAHAKV